MLALRRPTLGDPKRPRVPFLAGKDVEHFIHFSVVVCADHHLELFAGLAVRVGLPDFLALRIYAKLVGARRPLVLDVAACLRGVDRIQHHARAPLEVGFGMAGLQMRIVRKQLFPGEAERRAGRVVYRHRLGQYRFRLIGCYSLRPSGKQRGAFAVRASTVGAKLPVALRARVGDFVRQLCASASPRLRVRISPPRGLPRLAVPLGHGRGQHHRAGGIVGQVVADVRAQGGRELRRPGLVPDVDQRQQLPHLAGQRLGVLFGPLREGPKNGLWRVRRENVRAAAREQGEQPEAYRKRIMAEELGVEHLYQVSATTGFDVLMARACRDAGDDAAAIKYALGAITRLRHLIMEAADLLAPGNALGYVAGVMIQSRTVRGYDQPTLAARLASDTGWLDLTNPQLRRLLAMLKTHLRRHAD